jgi:hypothetical protein
MFSQADSCQILLCAPSTCPDLADQLPPNQCPNSSPHSPFVVLVPACTLLLCNPPSHCRYPSIHFSTCPHDAPPLDTTAASPCEAPGHHGTYDFTAPSSHGSSLDATLVAWVVASLCVLDPRVPQRCRPSWPAVEVTGDVDALELARRCFMKAGLSLLTPGNRSRGH